MNALRRQPRCKAPPVAHAAQGSLEQVSDPDNSSEEANNLSLGVSPPIDNQQRVDHNWPTIEQVHHLRDQRATHKVVKDAWGGLLNTKPKCKDATPNYFPFANVLWLLLFIGRLHKTLGITREI